MLALVCVVGAALRFATLDVQSLWFDEAVTAQLMRLDLPELLNAIPDSESSPPLYYVLEWLWTQLLGTGEVGVRSLSALLGTATIPLVWALGRRLGGDRAGLLAAALVAVNPMLIWFSQEARLRAAGAARRAGSALWLRALDPRERRGSMWGLAARRDGYPYYAIFLVAAHSLWLVYPVPASRGQRPRGAPIAAGAPLASRRARARANAAPRSRQQPAGDGWPDAGAVRAGIQRAARDPVGDRVGGALLAAIVGLVLMAPRRVEVARPRAAKRYASQRLARRAGAGAAGGCRRKRTA